MTVHVRPPVDGATIIPIRRAGVVAAEFCKFTCPSRFVRNPTTSTMGPLPRLRGRVGEGETPGEIFRVASPSLPSPARGGGREIGASVDAEIAAVFERSFYLRAADVLVCIGEPSIGNGPLTLIADTRVAPLRFQPGEAARIAEDRVAIGSVVFTSEGCEPWNQPSWPRAAAPNVLAEVRHAVVRRAATAPVEGFGRAIANMSDDAFARIARGRLARLRSWLVESLAAARAPASASPVRDLVGLGHGLTPSGDDVLIGALALLDALGERRAYAHLAHAINLVPPGLTSPLSHCFLRVAAAGHVGEGLHEAVSSIVRGDADAAIAAIRAIGHSSGWDMMAGMVTALDAISPRS